MNRPIVGAANISVAMVTEQPPYEFNADENEAEVFTMVSTV